jgi:hypothetical protein
MSFVVCLENASLNSLIDLSNSAADSWLGIVMAIGNENWNDSNIGLNLARKALVDFIECPHSIMTFLIVLEKLPQSVVSPAGNGTMFSDIYTPINRMITWCLLNHSCVFELSAK